MLAALLSGLKHSPLASTSASRSLASSTGKESKTASSDGAMPISAVADESVKAHKLLDEEQIRNALAKYCCRKECLKRYSFNDFVSFRSFYLDLGGEKERLAWLMHAIREQFNQDNPKACAFSLRTQRVCARTFFAAYGLCSDKFYHAARLVKSGASCAKAPVHGNTTAREAARADWVYSWLRSYCAFHCDQPSEDRWVLTGMATWGSLYQQYQAECLLYDLGEPVSSTLFHSLRRHRMQHVQLARASDHARCDLCLQLRHAQATATGSIEQLRAQELLQLHRSQQGLERVLLNATALAAREHNSWLHMAVDYMKSWPLPHDRQTPKTLERLHGMDLNVAGTLESGTDECFAFFHLAKISKNVNSVLTFLYLHLCSLLVRGLSEGAPAAIAAQARAPGLIFQLDNSWSQNKNRWMNGFCALLVAHRFFETIELRYLWRGHSHAAIDQRFSTLSKAFKRVNTHDLYDVLAMMSRSVLTMTPVVVEGVLDWQSFLNPHLEPITGHTGMVDGTATGGPHGVRFTRDDEGHAVFIYSDAPGAAQPVWRGQDGVPRGEAKFQPIRVLRSLPAGVPARAPTIWLDTPSQEREALAFARYENEILGLLPSAVDGHNTSAEIRWRYDALRTGTLCLQKAAAGEDGKLRSVPIGEPAEARKADLPAITVSSFDGNVFAAGADAFWAPLRLRQTVLQREAVERTAADGKAARIDAGLPALPHTVVHGGAAATKKSGGRRGKKKGSSRRDGFEDEESDDGLGGGGDGSSSKHSGGEDEPFEVASLLADRPGPPGCSREFLVEWQGYDASEASWQPAENIAAELVAAYDLRHGAARDLRAASAGAAAAAVARAGAGSQAPAAPPAAAAGFIGQRVPGHSVRGVVAVEPAAAPAEPQPQQQRGRDDEDAAPQSARKRKRRDGAGAAAMDETADDEAAQQEEAPDPAAKKTRRSTRTARPAKSKGGSGGGKGSKKSKGS